MNAVTGNMMVMEHFQDWYYLEALRANITMAISRKPELQFSHAVERLSADVDREFERLSHSIALRVYVYIWTASLGEARHADECADEKFEELTSDFRFSVYRKALDFFPSDENIQAMKYIYDQRWTSGFGGRAWLDIVNAMDYFGTLSDVAFIDHCIDLEHNGGTVFNKPTMEVTNFDTRNAYALRRNFLGYKFEHDILRDSAGYEWEVSRKVYSMIVRFSNIIEKINAVEFCLPKLETLSDYSVEWGMDTLTIVDSEDERYSCDNCGDKLSEDDTFSTDCNTYCESCYDEMYASCEKCGETLDKSDLLHTDDGYDYCQECIEKLDYVQCNDCEEYTQDYIVTADDNELYCMGCKDKNADHCEECDEWFGDIVCHNDENHETEQEEETPPVEFVKTEKTYKIYLLNGEHEITTKVLDFPETGLFIFSIKEAYKALGQKHSNDDWGIMTPCGLWYNGNDKTRDATITTLQNTKDLIDWNTIQTKQDWINLDNETIEKIRKAVYV